MVFTCALLVSRSSSFALRSSRSTHVAATSILQAAAAPTLSFDTPVPDGDHATVLVAKKYLLKKMVKANHNLEDAVVDAMLDSGKSSTTFLPNGTPLSLCILPDKVTRNNHPLSVHKMITMVQSCVAKSKQGTTTVVQVGGVEHPGPIAAAIAKAFPLYSRKTKKKDDEDKEEPGASTVILSCLNEELQVLEDSSASAAAAAEGVRLAGRLMDATPEELTTSAFSKECRLIADRFSDCVTMTEIIGTDLDKQGYGGIYGVGKAAECPPRLVVLEYEPPTNSKETVALVGKGIVYDTGGLSLKSKDGMPGMKHDMGGAAGMLGGFLAAVSLKVDRKVKLVLCLAENAIGPTAFRNDDILTLYSGKTVEVNNCDAEGRLVLGDGVAHATQHFEGCDLVVDMATLTGAQLVATGKTHAGILANSLDLEQRAVKAGLLSGDLVYPMVYAPEMLMSEFDSKVADMKNSVKDRGNAQASCAGHFIEAHIHEDYTGGWLHVDMAGPGSKDQRGTGYGVGLVLAILEAPGFC
jgi:probable aminopeptidase NPEPL1